MGSQATLQQPVMIEGIGLHSGEALRCRLCPAPEHTGVVFARTDIAGIPIIPARVDVVVSTHLSTRLQLGEASIQTVEHLLAALTALGVSNCRVEINGPEIPIVDGSALPWVEGILGAGISPQAAARPCYLITEPVTVWEGDAFVTALPAPEWRYTYGIDFPQSPIRQQWYSWAVGSASFPQEIGLARTFVRQQDIVALQKAGLIRGGSLGNALVCSETEWLNPPCRIDREPVRHKLIDLLGDLSLLGADLQGHVLAYKAGHRLHVQLAQTLLQRQAVTLA